MNAAAATELPVIRVYGPPEVVERYTLYPTTVDVLAVQLRLTECATGVVVPVPESAMLIGELVALLVTETAPEKVAADAGVNVTASVAVWPAPTICPAATPVAANPAPVTLTVPIVIVELPPFVSTTFCAPLLPTATLPNDRLVVLAVSDIVVETPVPETGIAVGELAALLTSEIAPDTAPAVAGPNATLKVVLLPLAIVVCAGSPVMLNPVPVTEADEIVSGVVPLF